MTAAWPPNSPTQTETGEYGFQDVVNPTNADGCPNGELPDQVSARADRLIQKLEALEGNVALIEWPDRAGGLRARHA